MYKCPECGCNYISGDVDPETLCKWCINEDPAQTELIRLREEIKALEEKIDAMGDMNFEVIYRYRDALEFIASGCLVPPDGGSPDLMDAVNAAKEALEVKKEEK